MNTIKAGDRISWRLTYLDGYVRHFGVMLATQRITRSFRVMGDDGIYRVIPIRFITKECE